MALTRPLPGIRFEAPPDAPGDVLPRMDIPVLIGLAAAGPINVPVAVEDAGEFSDVFGADLALPRDIRSRNPRYAHLAPAVRSFFRNRGRRCWVVRVAHKPQATANFFLICGLMRVDDDGEPLAAVGVARSEGSWSDALRVRTNLVTLPLQAHASGGQAGHVIIAARRDLAVGELLRLSLPDTTLFLAVDSLTLAGPSRLRAGGVWFSAEGNLIAPPVVVGTPVVDRLTFDLLVADETGAPWQLTGLGFTPAHPRYFGALPLDRVLYQDADQSSDQKRREAAWTDLRREAAHPRFPIAADIVSTARFDHAVYLPIGMSVLPAESHRIATAEPDPFARNGIDPFNDDLFMRGIAAAALVEEATTIAVPDAIHRGWNPDVPTPVEPPQTKPIETAPPTRDLFFDCKPGDPLPVPSLHAADFEGGSYNLSWTPAAGVVDELEEALCPDLSDAAVIATSSSGTVHITARIPGSVLYYRVRRSRGEESVVSAPIVVSVDAAGGRVNVAPEQFDDALLVAVHQKLLRMCAERADIVALLSLPQHYDEVAALAHAARLEEIFAGRPQILSYGALWHPWLIGRDETDDALRAQPPDGAIAGVIAARANRSGAWVAPANEPLEGVVSLTPRIAPEMRQALQDAAVNVIRQEPRGFLPMDADTLCPDDEIRPLNVRRLLIVIRRAALTLGNDYAFEPNGGATRRAVKGAVESLLGTMFRRGAFAGRTPAASFRVTSGAPLNDERTADAGQLITEIRVAPSRPLTFLTVRMLQSGGATQIEEGR